MEIKFIKKRDGTVVAFDSNRITQAIFKAMKVTGEGSEKDAKRITDIVVKEIIKNHPPDYNPSVEEIQDVIETQLILQDFSKTAKAYILYRQERSELRAKRKEIPEHIKKLVAASKKYFSDPLAEFLYYRTYSRWIESENRRETWIETIDRYMNFMREKLGDKLTEEEYKEIKEGILNMEVMPSMRLLWGAGQAVRKTNVSAYNCSFIAPRKIEDFAEIMYLLMCGTGVGFSVESQTSQQFPIVKRQTGKILPVHIIEDSKEGWANTLTLGVKTWYSGKDIKFDYSQVRLAGARLKTMGGRSSGPGPLRALLDFTRKKILNCQNRRLHNIDIYDIICKIGEVVVMGGVRRSALISLSDLDDEEMRDAKKGQFYLFEPQRSLVNNSAVYSQQPTAAEFLDEWVALVKSGTGERGIFNRGGLKTQLPIRRRKTFQKYWQTAGMNPCGEIILRSKQFCNLTEVVARPEDNLQTLLKKMRLATILGTYQATLTNFPFISKEWETNCEEERLLGVSLTGQWDCPEARKPGVLDKLKEAAIEINQEYSKRFGIKSATAITCVKPSGTVSQLVNSSSGMHPRHAKYYIRRIRISTSDPLFKMLKDQKFPYLPEAGQSGDFITTYVLEFPVKAPENAVTRDDLTALQQLEYWKIIKEHYTEHNPSITISVGNNEWIAVANWLYEHWDILGGLSFLPREEHVYPLAPYEAITREQYEELLNKMPEINFSQILLYEKEDETAGNKELACVAGVCES